MITNQDFKTYFNKIQSFFNRHQITVCFLYFIFGGLLTLSFAPFDFYLLAPLFIFPIFYTAIFSSPRDAARHSFFYGIGLFLSGSYWIYISVYVFGKSPIWLAIILTAALIAFMAFYFACMGWLMSRLINKDVKKIVIFGPIVWVFIEWLRGWAFSGFPWLSLGYSQIDSPLSGWAPIFGVYGISLMLLLSISGCFLAIFKNNYKLSFSIIILPWLIGYGLQTFDWTTVYGAPIKTTIVQGGIPQDKKWLSEEFATTLDIYRNTATKKSNSDLIVWPEVAIPAAIDQVKDYINSLQETISESSKTLIFGILERDFVIHEIYNSVLLLDGKRQQIYRKHHLVPFGEYFPVPDFIRNWMRLMSLPNRDFTAGSGNQGLLVTSKGVNIAAAICYENFFGAEQLHVLPDAKVLINVSNDAWFGDSIAPHQNLQMARMRAIETGRSVIRSTNNGISAFINPHGDLMKVAPQFEFAVINMDVELRDGLTPYAQMGNWPIALLFPFVVGCAIILVNRNDL